MMQRDVMSNYNVWTLKTTKTTDTTIVTISILAKATWDDYHAMMREGFQEANKLQGNCDLILDSSGFPLPDGMPVPHFLKTAEQWSNYPNVKSLNVIMRMPLFAEAFANLVNPVLMRDKKLRYFKSVELALIGIDKAYRDKP